MEVLERINIEWKTVVSNLFVSTIFKAVEEKKKRVTIVGGFNVLGTQS